MRKTKIQQHQRELGEAKGLVGESDALREQEWNPAGKSHVGGATPSGLRPADSPIAKRARGRRAGGARGKGQALSLPQKNGCLEGPSKKRWRHRHNKGSRKSSSWGAPEPPSRPGAGGSPPAPTQGTRERRNGKCPIDPRKPPPANLAPLGIPPELTFCQGKSSHRHWLGNSWSTSWTPPPQPPAATSSPEEAGRGLSALRGCPHSAWLLPTTASRFDDAAPRTGLSLNVNVHTKMPVRFLSGRKSDNAKVFLKLSEQAPQGQPRREAFVALKASESPLQAGGPERKVLPLRWAELRRQRRKWLWSVWSLEGRLARSRLRGCGTGV